MARRYAIAPGNWSDTATWDGGTLPGVSDTVHANGYLVTIDVDITVNTLTAADNVAPAISAGGNFYIVDGRTVTANIVVGNSPRYFVYIDGVAAVNIIGNVTGGSAANAYGIYSNLTATLHIVGNVSGGIGNFQSRGIHIEAGIDTVITGNVYGNIGAGVYMSGPGKVLTVNGNVSGGLYFGISNGNNGNRAVVNGIVIAGINSPGIENSLSTSDFIIMGSEHHANGYSPLQGFIKHKNHSATYKVLLEDLTTTTLQDLSALPDVLPAESDVKEGVVYDSGDKTGTLKIPAKEYVALGIPVGDEVGTAGITPESFLQALQDSDLDLAERLRNVATVQTVASQLAAAL